MKTDDQIILEAIKNAVKELFPDKDNCFHDIITHDVANHVLPAVEVVKIRNIKTDTRQY